MLSSSPVVAVAAVFVDKANELACIVPMVAAERARPASEGVGQTTTLAEEEEQYRTPLEEIVKTDTQTLGDDVVNVVG